MRHVPSSCMAAWAISRSDETRPFKCCLIRSLRAASYAPFFSQYSCTLSYEIIGLSLAPNSLFPRQGRHIHFLETLHELAARVAGSELPQELDMMINDKMVSKLPKVRVSSSCIPGI